MDVSRLKNYLVYSFCIVCIAGCNSDMFGSNVFSDTSESCQSTAIQTRFLVKWIDGTVTVEKGENREQFLKEFVQKNLPNIRYVENDQKITLQVPGGIKSEDFAEQADNWGDADIQADSAWAAGNYGNGVVVGVLDTGIDASHPQLKNQILYNPGESGADAQGNNRATNGIDDDGNGLIDDYAGYQFELHSGQGIDAADHGTHVSGIIAAQHNATTIEIGPVQGVAPQAKIVPAGFMDAQGEGSMSVALRALNYAVSRGARVVNASWGGTACSQTLKDAVSQLYAQNIAFITAAGNNGNNIDLYPEFPASYNLPSQLTIGAIDPTDMIADFSNYGATDTHVFAPGVNIISTVPNDSIASMSGTSMATPFVTGAVALLMSDRPKATLDQIRQAIYRSAIVSPNYQNASHGRLNVAGAIQELEKIVSE